MFQLWTDFSDSFKTTTTTLLQNKSARKKKPQYDKGIKEWEKEKWLISVLWLKDLVKDTKLQMEECSALVMKASLGDMGSVIFS